MSLRVLTDEPLCVSCARSRSTCCQTREIYVTPGDRNRISARTGDVDFWEMRPASPDHLDQDDDPAWLAFVFRADGTRPVLRRRPNGDCTFLGAEGCVLSEDTRPLVCRLYPFDYTEAGLRDTLQHDCPVEMIGGEEHLVFALHMSRAQAEAWRSQLYREIRVEAEDESRADVRSPL